MTTNSLNGKKGFIATTNRYFGGDKEAHVKWLGKYGAFVYARMTPYGRQKILRGTAFNHPGKHPAWTEEEGSPCNNCGVPVRDCFCKDETPF
jgi:hypothetical protein